MADLENARGWRLVAWGVLALAVLAGLVGVWLVLSNPLLALAVAATAGLMAAVIWRLLLASGAARWWTYALALLGLVAVMLWELHGFVQDVHNVLGVVALAALLGAMAGLAVLLRRRYRREAGRLVTRVGGDRPKYLIINPKSGSGRAMKARIPELAAARGVRVLMLEPGGSLDGLVDRAVEEGAGVLGVSGGDGSIGVVAAAAMRHDLPLVVLPGGTRCHFARDLGLDPADMPDSLRSFGGREVRVDAGEINGRVFLNNASFGIYADVVRQPGYRERKLRSAVQTLRRGVARGATYPLEFTDGSGSKRDRAVMVLVGVNRYETVRLMEFGSRHRLDEGILQMMAVYRIEPTLLEEISGAWRLGQSAAEDADFEEWTAKEFMISNQEGTMQAGVDGELVELDSPVRLRVRPGALRLMVPPEGLRARAGVKRMLGSIKDYARRGKLPHA